MICRRSFVSGRVQGVFYRATCVRKAASLGTIKEMSEDPEAGSLTIKVEV